MLPEHLLDVHFTRVDLQDAGAGLLSGMGELNLPIQTSRSQQGWVQNVHAVGGSNHLQTCMHQSPISNHPSTHINSWTDNPVGKLVFNLLIYNLVVVV